MTKLSQPAFAAAAFAVSSYADARQTGGDREFDLPAEGISEAVGDGDFSEFGRDFLPAAGVGLRFVLSQKHRISLSADVASGKNGTEFYFGVGEAF